MLMSVYSEKVFQFQGQIIRAETKEHVPPDTTAGIFWLKNRRPEAWRERQQHEHTGKDGEPIQINHDSRPPAALRSCSPAPPRIQPNGHLLLNLSLPLASRRRRTCLRSPRHRIPTC
jgi:hypothetical protein